MVGYKNGGKFWWVTKMYILENFQNVNPFITIFPYLWYSQQ